MRKQTIEEGNRKPRESSETQPRTGKAQSPPLVFRPLTPRVMDALGTVLRGSWGAGCWCMYPRLTDSQMRELPGLGTANQCRREAMTQLARRRRAPGLLAFEGDEPVGWIASAPRTELARIETSRATPRRRRPPGRAGHCGRSGAASCRSRCQRGPVTGHTPSGLGPAARSCGPAHRPS
jgi:hypothetical protein